MKKLIFLMLSVLLVSFSARTESKTNSAMQVNADTLKAKLARAQTLLGQGKSEDASAIYLDLMKNYPAEKEPVRGWIMVNGPKWQGAGPQLMLDTLNKFEKLFPDNIAILFWKGFLQASTGQNEQANQIFEKLIKLQPDTAVNYTANGQVLMEMSRFDEAFQNFEKATQLDPKRWDVFQMKALALAKLKRYDEALATINRALDMKPNYPFIVYYNRACIYSLSGDKKNALDDLKTSFSMNPSLKAQAVKDEDLKSLYDDEEFKKITM
jgi:tetratricopeptide (TPR) repeat protein